MTASPPGDPGPLTLVFDVTALDGAYLRPLGLYGTLDSATAACDRHHEPHAPLTFHASAHRPGTWTAEHPAGAYTIHARPVQP